MTQAWKSRSLRRFAFELRPADGIVARGVGPCPPLGIDERLDTFTFPTSVFR